MLRYFIVALPGRSMIVRIIIIIISIFKEDNVLSMIASLPYGPPWNIDYYRTFFRLLLFCEMHC